MAVEERVSTQAVPSVKPYLEYRDRGCRQADEYLERKTGVAEIKSQCLECPFYPGKCKQEDGEMSYSAVRAERDERIWAMKREGKHIDVISMELKISERTVGRVLKKGEINNA